MSNQKLTDLTELSVIADDDLVYVVDISDTTDDPTGSSFYAQAKTVRGTPRTTAESAAGVTPVDYSYDPGDVRRYGAALDGVTDDSGAVSDWLDVGLQGTALYMPYGTALCSTWAQKSVTTNLYIYGDTRGVIRGTSSSDFLRAEGGDINIQGVTFDLWSNVIENVTGDSGTTDELIVRDCQFSNITLYGIYIERPVGRCEVTDNYWNNMSTGCILIGRNVYSAQNDWRRLIVSRNTAININNTGAGNTHFALLFGLHATITDNYIENVTSNTGEAWGIYTKARYVVTANNNVNGVSSTSSNAIAINIKGDDRASTTIPQGFAHQITGNSLLGSGEGVGIACQNEDANITGNYVENFDDGIATTGGGDGINISDNRIIGSSAASNIWGINANGSCSNLKITNNHIETCGDGIRSASDAQNNWLISGNLIEDCLNYAIELQQTGTLTGVTVSNNIARNCAQFIFLSNCDNYVVRGNQWTSLSGAVTDWINFDGVTNGQGIIQDNSGLEVQTTDGSTTTIYHMEIPDDTAWQIEATVVSMESDGSDRNLYKLGGLFYSTAGAAVQQGSTYNLITAIESDAAWNVTLDVTSTLARVRVLGAAATTINWVCDLNVVGID